MRNALVALAVIFGGTWMLLEHMKEPPEVIERQQLAELRAAEEPTRIARNHTLARVIRLSGRACRGIESATRDASGSWDVDCGGNWHCLVTAGDYSKAEESSVSCHTITRR